MHAYNSLLVDIKKRLEDAIQQLRVQQNILANIRSPRSHQALLMLLSNGLRVYYWLQNQRRRLTHAERKIPPRIQL